MNNIDILEEKEKKAIEELKKVRWNSLAVVVKNEDGKMDISYFTEKDKKTLLNLIEKQSKEIEELKEENKKLTDEYLVQRDLINPDFLKDYISKDKIKAKIEEINKEMLNEENSLELFYRKKYCKEVLQSLLGKE